MAFAPPAGVALVDPLEYYAAQGAALFPIPVGKKAPGSKEFWAAPPDSAGVVRAGSFKHHASRDPAQWAAWRAEHPGCNFGVVAFASRMITLDTDIKPIGEQTPEDARAEAWAMRGELLASWGMDANTLPHVQSPHGGWHDHFAVPEHIDAATLKQPDAIKQRINVRVVGYTVAAGGYYDGTEKNDAPGWYQLFENAPAPHPAPAALLEHCAPAKPRDTVAKIGTHDRGDVGNLIGWLNQHSGFDAYEDWCALGMALKIECGDDAKELWALSHNDTVTDDVIESKWESFASEATSGSVTLNSFMKRAHQLGWTGTIRPSVASMFGGVAQLAQASVAGASIAPTQSQMMPLPEGVPLPSTEDDEDAEPMPELCFPEDFGDNFTPPDYLVDGILQRRFCYSLTAQTGTGKTTVAMRIAAHVALGKSINEIEVERGTVLYFAGENPTDVEMRWFGLTKEMGIDPKTTDVIFVYGTMHFSKTIQRYALKLAAKGVKLSLVVVDTAAAYFEGDNDNDNVQAGNHARMLRSLVGLPGGPCVLVLCHPTKNAQDDNLVPRGGGAFLNEVDGNIALRRDGDTIVAAALGKFRGPEFPPINFGLKVIRNHPRLVDTKGRAVPTIVAMPISASEQARQEEKTNKDQDKALEILCNEPGINTAAVARAAGWGNDSKKASRALAKLAEEKLVKCVKKRWLATSEGQKYANMAAADAAQPVQKPAPLTPANLAPGQFPTPTRPHNAPQMPPVPT
jgi:hypothetical protein